ncbi:protein-glutamine gamma-glutamyltransferase 5-like [Cheilinus undulatus]|uniref:protein-glutamine gamma-glutamyltransferase 5-like n=1 Tax=Cheilinus undulatus TaxID=241271 RepID=UPI001BD42C15|nr:protein-glutamine gamma-glutamyltransferase 5-like [Cheilinus undulatus]
MPNITKSFFKDIDLHCPSNNFDHRTKEISKDRLTVRRGQAFKITVTLTEPFLNSSASPLFIKAITGMYASQEQGTMSYMSIPDGVELSPKAKAVWSVEVYPTSSPLMGELILSFIPPANAPVGEYVIMAEYKKEEKLLGMPMVLFNPWCPEDAVYMEDEKLRQEYVMNENGKIWRGSALYNRPMDWDFGQFEDNMVTIGQQLLDLNRKHKEDPALDVSLRWDPAYVGRVISAMINSEGDKGVLEGNWSGEFSGGRSPGHWSGSSAILTQWLDSNNRPVKYGQCWVFAGVMCSVMRFFGIPCRVVTNFASAHDNNANLTIDTVYDEEGNVLDQSDSVCISIMLRKERVKKEKDRELQQAAQGSSSLLSTSSKEKEEDEDYRNFHVWTEGWMKRHDQEQYGGWQVLDPTPQELSDGVYCCGPSPKLAILSGHTEVEFDTPFVYAEVNSDCVDWLLREDGTLEKMETDTKRVGQFISTKAVGSDEREDLTLTYKPQEGTFRERLSFVRAVIRHYENLKKIRKEEEERRRREEAERRTTDPVAMAGGTGVPMRPSANTPPDGAVVGSAGGTPEVAPTPPPPKVNISFEEVSKPINGKDVCLNLKLNSKSTKERPLIIKYNIQAMNYNGRPTKVILKNKKEETLLPGKDLTIPIVVKFSDYCKPMLGSDGMKVSVIVKDQKNPDHPYHADDDVILEDPPISVTMPSELKVGESSEAEVVFMNPVNETLKNCTLTICGTGLWRTESEFKLTDLKPSSRIRIKIPITPYKAGDRKLAVDFDCSVFRDIKGSCTVKVTE